ncbi:hypothetical protein [Streptomyces sp. NPDC048508]|uniref:hypothetical protein n=1 Tax=Streptomyces sp. NPDC048508 TaxID=3365561 RepID=UPI0037126BE1
MEPTAPGLLPPEPSSSAGSDGTTSDADATGDSGDEKSDPQASEKEEKEKAEKLAAAWRAQIARYKADRRNGGILAAFEVTDEYGNPVSAYRIFSDTGSWTDWDLKIEAFLVEMLFLGSKWLVSFACFLIAWSLSFKLAGLLLKPALLVSDALYSNVLLQIGLPGVCLTYAGVVAGWHLMFGRKARGWGEAAAALVISALSVTVLLAPPKNMLSEDHGLVASTRSFSLEVAALVLDNKDFDSEKDHGFIPPTTVNSAEKGSAGWESPDAKRLTRPITDALVDAFVVRPSMLLSYGQTFDGKCAKEFQESRLEQAVADQWLDTALDSDENAARKHIPWIGDTIGDLLDSATSVSDEIVKEKVQSNGPIASFEKSCVKGDNAKSLKKASMDKVGGALFMLIAALLVCVFIIILDGGFLYAQFCLAIEAMIARVALVIGVLPGGGRSWLTARAVSILRYLMLMVLSVGALSILVVMVTTIIHASDKDIPGGVTVRFVLIDIVCIGMLIYRKQLTHGVRQFSMKAQAKIGNSVFGGGSAGPANSAPKPNIGKMINDGRSHARRLQKVVGGAATLAAGPTKLLAASAMKLGKIGLKSTIGVPVYGPRAARQAGKSVAGFAEKIAKTPENLSTRISEIGGRYSESPTKELLDESAHNARAVWRVLSRQPGIGPYMPAPRSETPRPTDQAAQPARAASTSGRHKARWSAPEGPASSKQARLRKSVQRNAPRQKSAAAHPRGDRGGPT